MIISISGKKLHGKDSTANVLCSKFGYTKISLADPIKSILHEGLKEYFELNDFYDQNIKDLNFSDYTTYDELKLTDTQITRLIAKFEEYYDLTKENKRVTTVWFQKNKFKSLREIMQRFGTDLARNMIETEIWLKVAKKTLDPTKKLVCADSRFPNERQMFKDLGGKLLLVKRNLPNSGDGHISENQLGEDSDYDHIVYNFYDLAGLDILVRNWYENILKGK